METPDTRPSQQARQRVCTCGHVYTIEGYLSTNPDYFSHPYNYDAGCETTCLSCWLGIDQDEGAADVDGPKLLVT